MERSGRDTARMTRPAGAWQSEAVIISVMPGPPPRVELSIVTPVFCEQDNIAPLVEEVRAALRPLSLAYELIFVDDGSVDASAELVQRAADADPRVRLVRLSRNFGHQAALVAGLEHARGEAVVTLDGDLQHPPALIPEMVRRWRAGAEIVQAVRAAPADDSPLKRAGSRAFYRLLSALSRIQVRAGATDFRLMSREAADAFLSCPERNRFNRGLAQWIGFRQEEIPYRAAPRRAGRTKYSYRAMLRLAADAIFSFSVWPLRLAGLAGVGVSLAAAAYLLFVLWARIFTDRTEPGWSSLLATTLVLGGMQLIVLWIIGEYLGRLYEEARRRPLYIVRAPEPRPQGSLSSDPPSPGNASTEPRPPASASTGASPPGSASTEPRAQASAYAESRQGRASADR